MLVGKNSKQNQASLAEKRILVTGSSGYVGQALLPNLLAKGHQIIAAYRKSLPANPGRSLFPANLDLADAIALSGELRQTETIIHLAWESPVLGSHEAGPEHQRRLSGDNIEILQSILRAGEDSNCRRLIFLSCEGEARDITSQRYQAERAILASSIPQRYIVRAPLILGGPWHQDRWLKAILNIMRFPLIYPLPGKSTDLLSFVHLSDLVNILGKLATAEMPVPMGIINASSPQPLGLGDLFRRTGERLTTSQKIPIGGKFGCTMIHLMEAYGKFSKATTKLQYLRQKGLSPSQSLTHNSPFSQILPDNWLTIEDLFAEGSQSEVSKSLGAIMHAST